MSFLEVNIDDRCNDEYEKIKKGKQKFAIFKATADTSQIIPDIPEGAEDTTALELKPEDQSVYDYFCQTRLPDGEVRYAIYNYEIMVEGGYGTSKRDKCLFISWCPSSCKVKEKMVHASTKGSLKKYFGGFSKEIQAGGLNDLSQENVVELLGEMNNIKLAGTIIEFEGNSV